MNEAVPGVPELLPSRVAAAAVAALDSVAGAGISLFTDEFRVPIGTSDTAAAVAQRLQFSAGEGPCFAAQGGQQTVVAGRLELAKRWPKLAWNLMVQTPYQAVVSMPLTDGLAGLGTMDLYLRRGVLSQRVAVQDAPLVIELVSVALSAGRDSAGNPPTIPAPSRLDSPATPNPWLVPIASGMLTIRTHRDFPGTLAVLRARAHADNMTLDELARRIVQGTLPVSSLVD